jgi:chemotaxis protein CheD
MFEYETNVAEISDPDKETIEVLAGEVKMGIAGSILKSVGIGSCVVIAAYDSRKKLGAMAHVMHHAISATDNVYEPKTLYANDAINALLIDIGRAGSSVADIEVCLAGGANVLRRDHDTIWKDNVDSVIKLLSEKGINVVAQSVGGTERRSVSLDCETGTVTCVLGNEKEKILWKAVEKRNGFSRVESCASTQKPDDEELQKII